ncbi:MAG: TonB-dependent receptor [Ignavibacteriaceae bacterium]
MRKKLLTLILLFTAYWLSAQTTGKISGKVTDENDEPVYGANVVLLGTGLGAAADFEGSYFVINIPPGVYNVNVSAVGYTTKKIENVDVRAGLTTNLDVKISASAVGMQEIVVSYTRPPVQKDLTSKMQGFDSRDLNSLPVAGVIENILTRQAGISKDITTTPVNSQPALGLYATAPTDGLHFRGGRTNETAYYFDGVDVTDRLWGGFNFNTIGEGSIQSMETFTGTFGPQYGNAMSGAISIQPLDYVPSKYSARVSSFTDGFGEIKSSMNTYNIDASLSGPLFGLKNFGFSFAGKLYSTDGHLNGFIYPDFIDSGGMDKSGEPEEVPMAFNDNRSLFGKLIWQIADPLKLRIGYLNTSTSQGNYNHFFKYNPNGTPHSHLDGNLGYARLTHVLSKSTFYDVIVSYYQRKYKSHVYDSPEEYAVRPELTTLEFSIAGENYIYMKSNFERLEVKINFTSQITKQHSITAGISAAQMKTALLRINPTGWVPFDDYDYRPYDASIYVNDKMEFEDIGMVINIGGRFDYVNTNREFIENISDPAGAVSRVKPRTYFSPRFGISYPISDVAAFRFGYGHYYQFPKFFDIFQGTNRNYSGYPAPNVKELLGSPTSKGVLNEEKTINYEAGVQIALNRLLTLDITGYYRKISNLIGTSLVTGYIYSGGVASEVQFPAFDNINFATVKGIEVSLKQDFNNFFSWFLNYTYAQSLVSSSVLMRVQSDITRTSPADWDQPHSISFGAVFEFPGKWGFSVLGKASSGFPYTYNAFQPNALRGPIQSDIDLSVYKEFDLFSVNSRVFLQVINILNVQNVYWVYPSSGRPGQGTDPSFSADYYNNPSAWGAGRNIQMGISFTY